MYVCSVVLFDEMSEGVLGGCEVIDLFTGFHRFLLCTCLTALFGYGVWGSWDAVCGVWRSDDVTKDVLGRFWSVLWGIWGAT